MDKLKPCPFCGAEAVKFRLPERDDMPDDLWVVGCDGDKGSLCPCYIWKCTPFYFGEELAVKMWNNRV